MNDGTVVPSSVLFHSSFCAPNSTRWRAIPMSSQWTSLNSCTRWKALGITPCPGHEAAERDAMLRELQRLLEQCETRGASRSDRAWSGTSGYVAECERFFSRERLASALRFKPENICSV
jgi:hypothetical protein